MRNEENIGGDVDYYRVPVKHPKRSEPYVAECEDIIAALGMDFFEGEAFKAVWRKAAQRTLGVGKSGNTALRDAQKMAHYGARCLALEEQRVTESDPVPCPFPNPCSTFDPADPKQWQAGDMVRYALDEGHFFTPGNIYEVQRVSALNVHFWDNTDKPHTWGLSNVATTFEWVSRP